MRRISTATKAPDLHGPGKDGFKDANIGSGISPTAFEAAWCNAIQEEVASVVEAAALVVPGANTQLLQALRSEGVFTTAAAADNSTRSATTAFVKGIGLRVSGAFQYTSSSSMSNFDFGKVMFFNSSVNGVLTLPPISEFEQGAMISITNIGAGSCTLLANSGQLLYVKGGMGASSVELLNGDSIQLAIVGPNWIQISRTYESEKLAGKIAYFAQSTAPTGWLKANGALLSRSIYSQLFAQIGTLYGAGDGTTTFAIPDLRGEFLRGWDDARGIDAGRGIGTLQLDAMQGHRHKWSDANTIAASVGYVSGGGNAWAGGGSQLVQYTDGTGSGTLSDGTNGTPRIAAETRGRNRALLACIKF